MSCFAGMLDELFGTMPVEELAALVLSDCTQECTPDNCEYMQVILALWIAEEKTCSHRPAQQLREDHADAVGQDQAVMPALAPLALLEQVSERAA